MLCGVNTTTYITQHPPTHYRPPPYTRYASGKPRTASASAATRPHNNDNECRRSIIFLHATSRAHNKNTKPQPPPWTWAPNIRGRMLMAPPAVEKGRPSEPIIINKGNCNKGSTQPTRTSAGSIPKACGANRYTKPLPDIRTLVLWLHGQIVSIHHLSGLSLRSSPLSLSLRVYPRPFIVFPILVDRGDKFLGM